MTGEYLSITATSRVLYHMARADFLERIRRYSFLLTLAFAAGLAYLTFAGQITLQLGDYRGVNNSAWVGGMMTLVTTTFITLAGFYMVKNTVQRDEQTRVGLVLATTPMSRSIYVAGKALSNFAVLAAMVSVLAVAAVVLQVARPEGHGLELGTLLAPFLWVALPAVAVTAAVAVLFETLPVLRGGAGNAIYFFAWSAYLGVSGTAGVNDYLGFTFLMREMTGALRLVDPSYKDSFTLQAGPAVYATKTFLWNGVHWTFAVVLARAFWFGVAPAIAWLSAVFFHRFDPARGRSTTPRATANEPDSAREEAASAAPSSLTLRPLESTERGGQFPRLVASELRLMLKGRSWWWYLVAAGLFVASALVTNAQARQIVSSFAWLWPLLLWSNMGAREARYGTESLLFSCARALDRQLPAVWAAGFVLAMAAGGGLAIHQAVARDWSGLAALLAGAMFVPAMALAMGVWSGSSRLFEALYTMWWYVGPMNHVAGADFTGLAQARGGALLYLILAAALMAAAYGGRRRKLGYA